MPVTGYPRRSNNILRLQDNVWKKLDNTCMQTETNKSIIMFWISQNAGEFIADCLAQNVPFDY
jgi:hypothetical protein